MSESKIKKQKAWEEFEALVGRIEGGMHPPDAKVVVNDKVPDLVTGTPRQVDVTIRYNAGSVQVLVAMECRERVAVGDVVWIEQLITKRQSIGAHIMMGVSRAGFSTEAQTKAAHHGIVLRQVQAVAVQDFQVPTFIYQNIKIRRVEILFYGTDLEGVGLRSLDGSELEYEKKTAIRMLPERTETTVGALALTALSFTANMGDVDVADFHAFTRYENGRCQMMTDKGLQWVGEIVVVFDGSAKRIEAGAGETTVNEYRDQDGKVIGIETRSVMTAPFDMSFQKV